MAQKLKFRKEVQMENNGGWRSIGAMQCGLKMNRIVVVGRTRQ
jgi:hypothetical protein